MESKEKYSLKEALQIIAKHMKDLADKNKEQSIKTTEVVVDKK